MKRNIYTKGLYLISIEFAPWNCHACEELQIYFAVLRIKIGQLTGKSGGILRNLLDEMTRKIFSNSANPNSPPMQSATQGVSIRPFRRNIRQIDELSRLLLVR
jgi:hypothetical protein